MGLFMGKDKDALMAMFERAVAALERIAENTKALTNGGSDSYSIRRALDVIAEHLEKK